MRLTICLTICLAHLLAYACAINGKYTVIAPGTIHSNEKYTAAVTVHHIIQPCHVKVGITGPSYNESKQVTVFQNEVKHVEFDLPSLEKGDYNLTAEGVNCLENFINSTKLIYEKFENSVNIQTDKVAYYGGDEINYRVVFTDKDVKPAEPEEDAVIWFEDSERNRLKEIKNFKVKRGMYTGKFKISEFPITGEWRICVKNGLFHQEKVAHIFVKEKDSTKFEVQVSYNRYSHLLDDLKVVVYANYQDERPLLGRATMQIGRQRHTPFLIETSNLVNGMAIFYIKRRNYPLIFGPFTLNCTIEEFFTGIKVTKKDNIYFENSHFKVECVENCKEFVPGQPMDVKFNITLPDGSAFNNTNVFAFLEYDRFLILRPTISYYFNQTSGGDNLITFNVTLPALVPIGGLSLEYNWSLYCLGNEIKTGHAAQRTKSKAKRSINTEEYFVLEDNNEYPYEIPAETNQTFTIRSSQPLPYVVYNVISRGNILTSGYVNLADKPTEAHFNLTMEYTMQPVFYIYAYYVDESGRYHYTENNYRISLETYKNKLKLKEYIGNHGGEDVVFQIETTPNSIVAVSALTDPTPNPNTIFDFYNMYRYGTRTPEQGGFGKYPGDLAGCVTLTNADYFYNWTKPEITKLKSDPHYYHEDKEPVRGNTWIFSNIETPEDGQITYRSRMPNSMDIWNIQMISLHPTKGLGYYKTFIWVQLATYIEIVLPHSVKIGEVINVPVVVVNEPRRYYRQGKAFDVQVTLDNSESKYELLDFDNKIISEQKLSKNIHVSIGTRAIVYFLIKPKVTGDIMLKVQSTSLQGNRSLNRLMKVVPEGITQYANLAYLVNLNNEHQVNSSFELELAKESVAASEHVEFGVVGDILGPISNNLNDLVPKCCGEQTISTLLPNYLVMKHLKHLKRLTPKMETALQNNLEAGYQNMPKYRHSDGSFSNFGPSKEKKLLRNGSTGLTAYAVLFLLKIKEFVFVDDKLIEEGLSYLSKQQAENGTFTENFDYFYTSQRNHVTLTATAALAILESPFYADKYSNELNKGLEFIEKNIKTPDSLLAHAIGTYTLNKAKHAAAKENLSKLKSLAKTESGRMWWSSDKLQFVDVEITSFALLALLEQESTKIDDVLPIIKWLVAQRNSHGVFASIPDTVVGLAALIKFAQFANYEPAKMDVHIESKDKNETIKLTEDNAILYQSIEMPQKTNAIELNASGAGLALVQMSYQYNSYEQYPTPSFTIKTTRNDDRNSTTHYKLQVCVTYVGEGESSNMALLELHVPSGYIIYGRKLNEIKNLKQVGNIELKNADSLLVVYFDHLFKNEETCLTIQGWRAYPVAMQKPATIAVYDYYDPEKKATEFYELESKLCYICMTEEECNKCK